VQNYVDKFKRTVLLSQEGYDSKHISFLLRLSTALVEQYLDLSRTLPFVDHRKKELSTFSKKNGTHRKVRS
jgi:predicted transcriptional regulator